MARHKRADGTSWVTVNCVFCRTVFSKRAHHIANGQQPFCSRDCFFRRKRLKALIRLAQCEFQRRLKLTRKGDDWDRYCKREAASHRNDNEKSHQKTWRMKINAMLGSNRDRQAMREEVESRNSSKRTPVKNRNKTQTWTRYLRSAIKRAVKEANRSEDRWKIKCETWVGNQRARMRRKAMSLLRRN